jgi:hypothetical protein
MISELFVDLTRKRFNNLINTVVYRPAAGAGRVAGISSGTAQAVR